MTGERPLRVESASIGSAAVRLTVSGELDTYTADDLARRVREVLFTQRPTSIHLDLTPLDFIDVSGVRTLHDLYFDAAAAGCTLTISQAPQTTRWILDLLGLTDLFVDSGRPWPAEPVIESSRPRHAEPGS